MKLLTEEEIAETRKLHEGAQWLQPVVSVSVPQRHDEIHAGAVPLPTAITVGNIRGMREARAIVERVPALLSEVERSRALLKRIRRAGVDENDNAACPECKATFAEPCKPDCELAALIGEPP